MKLKAFGVFLLAALCAAAGFWGGREMQSRRAAEEARKVADAHRAETDALRASALAWADEVAKRQGEAVLRAFVAGVTPSLLAERRESLEMSAVSLLRIDGIAGILAVAPDNRVLYSSDAKVTTTGDAGEAGSWALGAREATRRPGARDGTFEIATPVTEGGRSIAAVWMEYAQSAVRDAARPREGGAAPDAGDTTESVPAEPEQGDRVEVGPEEDHERAGAAGGSTS